MFKQRSIDQQYQYGLELVINAKLGPHPRITESETWGWLRTLLKILPSELMYMKFGNHYFKTAEVKLMHSPIRKIQT